MERQKIFANDITYKVNIQTYKQLVQLKKLTNPYNPIKKQAENLNQIHFNNIYRWPLAHEKISISLNLYQKIKINTITSYLSEWLPQKDHTYDDLDGWEGGWEGDPRKRGYSRYIYMYSYR